MLAQTLLSLGELGKLEDLPVEGLESEGRSLVQAAKGLGRLFKSDIEGGREMINAALDNDPRLGIVDVFLQRCLEFNNSRLRLVVEKQAAAGLHVFPTGRFIAPATRKQHRAQRGRAGGS